MQELTGEMTVREALQFCSPAQQLNLQFWDQSFALKLREFHIRHIKTYETERQGEATLRVINSEVSTLLNLLDLAGVGDEIRKYYQPLREPEALSAEERAALPQRAQSYIKKLENELKSLGTENDRIEDRLRKANWAKWSR